MRQLNETARLFKFKLVLCMAFFLALQVSVSAQEFPKNEAVLHGLSYHSKDRPGGKDWNETNWGLAWRHVPSESLSWQLALIATASFVQPPTACWTTRHFKDLACRLGDLSE